MTLVGPEMPDVVFECVGVQETIGRAVTCVRKGGTIVVVGVFADKASIDLGRLQDAELNLIGTMMYLKEDYLGAIELIERGAVSLSQLITGHFPFHAYLEAYQFVDANRERTMKVLIDVDHASPK